MSKIPTRAPSTHPLSGRLAAPSFVLPGTVAENMHFLSGRVDETALCFFETRACLEYGEKDIPPVLTGLPLRCHVHLPVDLPWPSGAGATAKAEAGAVADLALAVCAKAARLSPGLAVLHPPEGSPALKRALLRAFAFRWQTRSPVPLLLENVESSDVLELGKNFLSDHGLGFCLDVGHLLGYAQNRLLDSGLPETAALVHWSAPGRRDEHLPLTEFTPPQRRAAAAIMARLPRAAVHLAEIFHWPGVAASLPVLAALAPTADAQT
ncbi:cobamide remodeling phosphodiesterase CbiR [uncultured Desulfovibrio sp.]|uniref:cobamide remodeling phosphodiesterase CbiR n=1 Tax=uncultured Desulfovibrio sp. TaxID=167968 RepID=UPI0003A0C361|nr:cobamide remodeling phosphodiesterase CbiR [uncultured Desulfovibrio sp.]